MTNRLVVAVIKGALVGAVLIQMGCEHNTVTSKPESSYHDHSAEQLHSLGWMGAQTYPLLEAIKITDPDNPDKEVSLGGLVVANVDDQSPLALAGLVKGDLILRVSESWVPIKEDPTLDLIELVERQISSGINEISIGVLRSGKYEVMNLVADKPAIDEGLPLPTPRFSENAHRSLQYLAAQQNEDGSFDGSEISGKLINTALAGLAFLAAEDSFYEEFASNATRVVEYFTAVLDPDELQLDPLTASSVALFLAESPIDLMDLDWLDRVGKLTDVFYSTQDEPGGWNVTEIEESMGKAAGQTDQAVESEAVASEVKEEKGSVRSVDVQGTFTTNQVLLAIGAFQRKGFSGENRSIEAGVSYLHEQGRLRIPQRMDRRIKAALSAGTAAALIALNCDRNDVKIRDYLVAALERSHDLYTSPALGFSGMFHLAIASRQLGNESWLQFYNATKYLVVALADKDGSTIEFPNVETAPLEFETTVNQIQWRSAHMALIQSIQSQQLKRILAIDAPDQLVARDGNGKESDGKPVAKVIEADSSAEELKKMILEKLKEQGMEVDESKLEIGGAKKK